MLKLKDLLLEDPDIAVVVGTIHPDKGILSVLTKQTHRIMGMEYGKVWRYNPINRIVYWGAEVGHNKEDEYFVESHLLKKYGADVKSQISLATKDFNTFTRNVDLSHGYM